MTEQQPRPTARLQGFAASFAASARRGGDDDGGGNGKPGLLRRVAVLAVIAVAVAAGAVGAGFLITKANRPSAQAAPSASATATAAQLLPSAAATPAVALPLPATAGGKPVSGGGAPVPVAAGGNAPFTGAAPKPATGATTTTRAVAATPTTAPTTAAVKATTKAATTAAASGQMIVGYASNKCVDVKDSGGDGTPLQLWSCGGAANQRWTFTGGTVRSLGLCLDIADADNVNGAQIQVARCNGGWAQKFKIDSGHNLVNTVTGQCVDARDQGTANGTRLQLWSCGGTSNQKWKTAT
ncbi:RICIN domain-containing protein [Actinoplanes sp. HUAS TT8]|uniref:RICIN domain-containing protein n=1 Tax=Actinoplanes sp. HUAS TT8 TaxID=3447453 RepID=UPI003F52902B